MKYSKSTNGFYDNAVHGNAIPADAVTISDDDWNALMTAQFEQGKLIRPNAEGYPEAVDRSSEG